MCIKQNLFTKVISGSNYNNENYCNHRVPLRFNIHLYPRWLLKQSFNALTLCKWLSRLDLKAKALTYILHSLFVSTKRVYQQLQLCIIFSHRLRKLSSSCFLYLLLPIDYFNIIGVDSDPQSPGIRRKSEGSEVMVITFDIFFTLYCEPSF